MRNFFRNTFGADTKITTNRQIKTILGTTEDKAVLQYKRCLQYINKVKKELVQQSEALVKYRRPVQARQE